MEITNCANCGAPLHGNVCEYCGTEYNLKTTNENSGKCGYEDVDVWTDCNGVLHRTIYRRRDDLRDKII